MTATRRHRGHQERALGGHAGAGQEQVERRGRERHRGGELLDREPERQRRDSASSQRQAANTLPATRTMCSPDTERMWASPEICMARQVAWSMPARTPATRAAAMAPAGPGFCSGDPRGDARRAARRSPAPSPSAFAGQALGRAQREADRPQSARTRPAGRNRTRRAGPAPEAAAAARAGGRGRRAQGRRAPAAG